MKYTVPPRLSREREGSPSCFTDEGSVLPADAIAVCDNTKSKPKESFKELYLSRGRGPDVEAKSQRIAKMLWKMAVLQFIRYMTIIGRGRREGGYGKSTRVD